MSTQNDTPATNDNPTLDPEDDNWEDDWHEGHSYYALPN